MGGGLRSLLWNYYPPFTPLNPFPPPLYAKVIWLKIRVLCPEYSSTLLSPTIIILCRRERERTALQLFRQWHSITCKIAPITGLPRFCTHQWWEADLQNLGQWDACNLLKPARLSRRPLPPSSTTYEFATEAIQGKYTEAGLYHQERIEFFRQRV